MAKIKQHSGNQVLDYMSRDYDSYLTSMRSLIPEKLPEWSDHTSEADFGNVLLELFSHMGDIISYYQDRIANESFLTTARERRSIINHLRLIGYSLATAAPAATNLTIIVSSGALDELLSSGASGEFLLRRGDAFATKSQKDKSSVRFEYNGADKFINLNEFIEDPKDNTYKIFTIPVEEGTLIKDDIIGISDGTANQRFVLNHSPFILRSFGNSEQTTQDIILSTELGNDKKVWQLKESLVFSREVQYEFSIEIDENDQAIIIFGDDQFGAIPPSQTIIKATYRVGGGKHGNVPAETITTIADAPPLSLLSAMVENREPATGGANRESIDHAVLHAPEVFRSLGRAVTAEDYKALALKFKGVGKVRAENKNWNNVILYIAPEGGGLVSDILRANLLAYFEDKRPMSTLIEIESVTYIKIYITAKFSVKSYYSRAEVSAEVLKVSNNLLAFDKVDFAHKIFISKFYEVIEAIEGIEYVTILASDFRREGIPGSNDEPGRIELRESEIPRMPTDPEDDDAYSAGIKIEASGGYG